MAGFFDRMFGCRDRRGAALEVVPWAVEPSVVGPAEQRAVAGRLRHWGGHCYATTVHQAFAGPSDSDGTRKSRLLLFEDGVKLGPRHMECQEIADRGGGLYAYYDGAIFLSSTDGTVPGANGRKYTYSIGKETPRILSFGGCHMNDAARSLHNRRAVEAEGLEMGVSYSPLEHLRLAQQQLGLRSEPAGIGHFAIPAPPSARPFAEQMKGIDALLVEVTAHTNVLLDELCLNRCRIIGEIVEPVGELGPAGHAAAMRWFGQGLIKRNEAVRSESAEAMLKIIEGTPLNGTVIRQILREARGVRQSAEEMIEDLAELRHLVPSERMLLISGPNFFLPDGRGVSWSTNLLVELPRIAGALAIPLVEIETVVAKFGFEASVKTDMAHHTTPFLDNLGDAYLEKLADFYGAAGWADDLPRKAESAEIGAEEGGGGRDRD